MKPIWIVDDDQSIRWVLEKALARENFATRSFPNAREAIGALDRDRPQVLVSDIRMPGGSGLELLQTVRERVPGLPVIIMTAFSDLDSAVAAFQGGAFDYLAKPFDIDKAVELIRRAVDESRRGEPPRDERVANPPAMPEMLGQASAMQDLFRAIGRLSHSVATVLITGESGTGKELVARALHRHSPRASGPFIALNTAAIPKDLLESELFGHERGAFTGAQAMRQGRFEQAENGTLFLDEIGDMPSDLQTRLLRVLSDGQFYRVGGHHPLRANVRVIAATHQNLEARVHQGLFREDLYHRLNVIRLRLPALRERGADIPLLARHFLQKSARELGVEPKRVSSEALTYLSSLAFPGNVRQLENLANWLTVMAPAQTIEITDLPPDLLPAQTGALAAGPMGSTGATGTMGPAHTMGAANGLPAAHTVGGAYGEHGAHGAYAQGRAGQDAFAQAAAGAAGVAGLAGVAAGMAAGASPGAHGAVTTVAAGGMMATAAGGAGATMLTGAAAVAAASAWENGLRAEVGRLLREKNPDVMDVLSRRFEAAVIREALDFTRGRKVEAAERLGIGRNTITRKIQELDLE